MSGWCGGLRPELGRLSGGAVPQRRGGEGGLPDVGGRRYRDGIDDQFGGEGRRHALPEPAAGRFRFLCPPFLFVR
jgi:hypothetical protein